MSDLNNYRPISNVSFLSKAVERLMPSSAIHRLHSTLDRDNTYSHVQRHGVGVLVLLDMSAAIDAMFNVLQQRFVVRDAALDWLASYYADRTQVVVVGTLQFSST